MRKYYTWKKFFASTLAGVVGGAIFGLASFFILNPMSEKEKEKKGRHSAK